MKTGKCPVLPMVGLMLGLCGCATQQPKACTRTHLIPDADLEKSLTNYWTEAVDITRLAARKLAAAIEKSYEDWQR